ncbi:MAG: GntR family transcriptional regulator, partial [Flaviflexus sp.]
MPSESVLQDSFGVSRMTVRGVHNVLADEGLL